MNIGTYTKRYPVSPVQLLHVRVQGESDLEGAFHHIVSKLGNLCTLLEADEHWVEALGRLRWVRMQINKSLLPLAASPRLRPGLPSLLNELAAGTSDDELARLAGRASQVLSELLARDTTPLLGACLKQLAGLEAGLRVGVLLDEGQVVPLVLEMLSDATHLICSVGTWATICRGPVLDRLLLFGPSEHQPLGLYKSGIAQAYTHITYAWVRPAPTPTSWFSPYTGHEGGMWGNYRFDTLTEGEAWMPDKTSPKDDAPKEAIETEDLSRSNDTWEDFSSNEMPQWQALAVNEWLPARRVLLGGSRSIYLGSALREGAFVLQEMGVHEVPVLDLAPGDWLVVPTAERDYHRALVDMKLGKRRDECRSRQDAWKTTLAQRVNERGIDVVAHQLRALGCRRAKPSNIANWAYGSVVCPQRQTDFQAIMIYLGRDKEYADKSYKLLKMIHSAAHQADDVLRHELNRGLANMNPKELDGEAEYPFSLSVGKDRIDFMLVQVASLGPETKIEQGRLGIITNNTDNI